MSCICALCCLPHLPTALSAVKTHPHGSLPRHPQGYGVYRFANKYGANVDGYSPIYTPDTWSESGDTYKLGTKGLIAWAGLVSCALPADPAAAAKECPHRKARCSVG